MKPIVRGRSGRAEQAVLATTLVAALVLWESGLRGVDHPAAIFRVELFRSAGLTLFNANWYGGHHIPGYGILFPALASVVGIAAVALVSTLGSVAVFAHEMARRDLPVALGGGTFAALMLVNLYEGRLPFALGVLFGLISVRLATDRRWVLAGASAVLTALASPLAAAFLALVLVAWALTEISPARPWRILTRPQVLVALAAVTPVLVTAAVFPEGGRFPYRWEFLALTVGFAAFGVLAVPRHHAPVRVACALTGIAAVVSFLVPNPMGGNLARLAVVGGPVLLVTIAPRVLLTVVAAVPLLLWQGIPLLRLVEDPVDPASDPAFHVPLIAAVERLADGPVRLEIPFTEGKWEAAHVAADVPLARGWERQLDLRYNAVLYDPDLDLPTYLEWLDTNGVSFVAIPNTDLEPHAEHEAALVAAAGDRLPMVWRDENWILHEVPGEEGLVEGPGRLVSLEGDRILVDAEAPGLMLVRIRFSPHFVVFEGGCVTSTEDGWTVLDATRPGLIEIESSLDPDLDLTAQCE